MKRIFDILRWLVVGMLYLNSILGLMIVGAFFFAFLFDILNSIWEMMYMIILWGLLILTMEIKTN